MVVFGRKSHLQNVVVVKIDDDDFRRKKVFEDFLDDDDDDERRRGSLSAVVVTIVVVVANDARGDDKSLVLESAERAKRFGNKSEQNAAFFLPNKKKTIYV